MTLPLSDRKSRRSPKTYHQNLISDAAIQCGSSFSGAVFNLSTTIVGAGIMALPAAVKQLGQYLLGHGFTILMDHRSLRELMSQAIQTPEQHHFLVRLLGFDYAIQ